MKIYKTMESTKGQLTAKELSVHLGMSWNSIQKYFFHLDSFPKKKIGNKWYFHKELLDAFLKEYHSDVA
ncbi:helix-turn-helix domain-containing protein [Planococcus donghaensis]|uniref:helix-turn-helix domain-containing protein n=1 Tax=Planococcus donghaensis TaxID=414778 RepID=UPI0037360387